MEEINSTVQPQFDGELSFQSTRKKVFRIDDDDNRAIRLNTADLGVIARLQDMYPKMTELASKYADRKIENMNDEDALSQLGDIIRDMDAEMRGLLDYVFDSDVSSACAPNGTMFDMFNGQFRFEIIIEELSKLYESNLSLEYRKMKARIDAKANKYRR